ncbi:MAG TPA: PAS domain-containing protein [Polyangia bacterium]|nr:PAS domain-containing protein [Polyangia bacterium]
MLIVEAEGLGRGAVESILEPEPAAEVVRVSVSQARELLRGGDFDVIVADETRLRGVLDAIFAFVGLFSLDGVVLDSNQSPLAAGGLERGEVVGHRFVSLPWFAHSELERARVSEAIAKAARGETSRFETNIQSRAGGVVYIDAAFAPLRGRDGAISHVVGTGVDVTVRRKAERELARSQARLSEAQRVAHVGSWEWDIARDRVTWSEELYRIYGVDPARHVPTYETFLAAVHPEDRAHTLAVLGKARENCTPFVYDHRILRSDDGVRMLHTRGDVVRDAEGRAARLVGSCWDITDRWEAMHREEAMRANLESVLERVSDGVVALNTQWRYTYVNGSGGRLLGREASTLVGQHIWTELPEGRGQRFAQACEQAMAEQRPVQIREHYPPRDRWFENRIYPSPDGLSIFFTDVTEQQKAQDALRASAAELRALSARLSDIREEERRLIARELHDQVGQALTVLKFDVAWLRGQVSGGEGARDKVLARLERMDEVLRDTLETTRRISASLRPPILDELGLPAAIEGCAREFEQRTAIACAVRVPADGSPFAPATALTLFRILQEALTNVARHAEARHVVVTLEVRGDEAVLTVADDGKGIDAGALGRATSLGLVGMRERALAIAGKVAITGAPGRGTTVTVTAPLALTPVER